MKILWVTNIALPEACRLMGDPMLPFGGWLVNASKELSAQKDMTLSVAFPRSVSKDIEVYEGANIKYASFPSVNKKNRGTVKNNIHLKQILHDFQPDIVHIFGTEYVHSLAMVNACLDLNVKFAVSIQGLVSVISKHYTTGLPAKIQKRFTARDMLKQRNILQQQDEFRRDGEYEIETIEKSAHVIGRTTWDKACVTQINTDVTYHYCNETLRDAFYENTWNLERCEPYSIFVSQGSYPIKGLHLMLEAMPVILKRFPDAKLYVGGQDITQTKTFKERAKLSSYAKYLKEQIAEYNLEKKVIFTGVLDEAGMCKRYVESHVFVCPSTIENSPNSLGEAMILGVPCVAAGVGGVTDMLTHKEEGFIYQHDAPYMLAHYVNTIFDEPETALRFSTEARERAMKTHDRESNTKQLNEIYRSIAR